VEKAFIPLNYSMGYMAFKDVGAVSCHVVWPFSIKTKESKNTVLVATSGDTGGAVAMDFWALRVEVIILYPSGKVSNIQENN
jgi:threonine synthase